MKPDKSQHLLVLTERFFPEEFLINDLVNEWISQGRKISVLTQSPSYPKGEIFPGHKNRLFQKEKYQGINVYRTRTILGYQKSVFLKICNYLNFSFLTTLAGLALGWKFSKIFIYHTGPLTLSLAAVIIKKIYRKKIIIWTQDIWPDTIYAYGFKKRKLLDFILDKFVAFIYGNCSQILVSCPGFVEKIRYFARRGNIAYLPQWVSQELVFKGQKKQKLLTKGWNFTFAGNIGKVQNLDKVILAFQPVYKKFKNCFLNIIGDGSNLDDLKKLAQDSNIANIIFWGRKPQSEMPQWLMASDVLIISLLNKPIFNLTIPSKFQTYLAAQKPIFCVMQGEVADIIKNNNIGIAVQPDDIGQITKGFLKLAALSRRQIIQFTNNMQHLLKDDFNRETLIGRIDNILWE